MKEVLHLTWKPGGEKMELYLFLLNLYVCLEIFDECNVSAHYRVNVLGKMRIILFILKLLISEVQFTCYEDRRKIVL